MATPMYLPNPVAAMPQPRFFAPQQNYSSVFGGAIQSLTSVADNFRRKQQAVEAAEKMATLMENEGMEMEANAYRQAAGAFNTNFFSTPDQNEQFNRGILSDALKLVTEKQERDLKARSYDIQDQYYQGLLENARDKMDNPSPTAQASIMRAEETARNNKVRALQNQEKLLASDVNAVKEQQQTLQSQASRGSLSKEEFKKAWVNLERDRVLAESRLNNARLQTQKEMNGGEAPNIQFRTNFYPPPDITTDAERKAEEAEMMFGAIRKAGGAGGGGYVLPRQGSVRVEEGPEGKTTTTTTPLGTPGAGIQPDPAIKGGMWKGADSINK